MATVQLLVGGDRNRELLADALGDAHDVRAGAPGDVALADADVDLRLVDGRAFREHRSALADRKAAAEPTFLPHLLLLGEADPGGLADEVWSVVDDVVETPVEPAVLRARVDSLLERRALSLELDRRRETSEQRFRRLFESIPDPTVVVAGDGTVTAMNDAFARTFGVDREAALGDRVSRIGAVPPAAVERLVDAGADGRDAKDEDEDGDEHEDPDGDERGEGDAGTTGVNRDGGSRAASVAGSGPGSGSGSGSSPEPGRGSASTVEVEIESADGRRRVAELGVAVVGAAGDGGGAVERIGVFRDVTAREESREALRRQVDKLEQFASIVSHDLRDPLNTAQAKVRLARRECDSEYLAELADVHDRMAALIEDVLTLAKQGRAIGGTEPVALAAAVERAWSTVDVPDGATLEHGDDLGSLEADPERLRALLENLFRNAGRHAGPEVTVRVGRLDDRRGFFIEDDGPGIPPDEREAVFEYGRTTDAEGSGLGLAIVAEVAEAHGWEVSLTDGSDGGARFEFAVEGPSGSGPGPSRPE